ncbi:MAG: penicillin-insensitive murein endopeptidase [Pseudomonadota bacterium]
MSLFFLVCSRFCLLVILLAAMPPLAANPWALQETPSSGLAQSLGGYTAGCLAGAGSLPLTGEGYQVMRPSRHRYFGHPQLLAYLRSLGQAVAQGGLGRMLVGDLSQPRGGPMPSGHQSHQVGLDADIWFRLLPGASAPLSGVQVEQDPMQPVAQISTGQLDPGRWSPRLERLLELAAQTPGVERIFVNPIIKRALCQKDPRRLWLGRLRPWWGHDAHFHVRLACPAGNLACRGQAPSSPGPGCDEDLAGWVKTIQTAATHPKKPMSPRAEPDLPGECQTVLAAAPALSSLATTAQHPVASPHRQAW